MAVGEGKFRLYARLNPPLEAGLWRLVADHQLKATLDSAETDMDVDQEKVHLRIRSPRYLLPPDQVLSTYPPANSFGSYGNRLPQVVIKRRTLPWERHLEGAPETTPWLALVLIAEGEARLETSVPAENCVTPGVTLEAEDEPRESASGNCLVVRKSIIDKVFPTRNDVDLLVHAREVDINDTELMMGDDDGFLAVVISNRLPLPGRDENGEEAPVKYLACLINLEGQYDALLEKSPDPLPAYLTDFMTKTVFTGGQAAADDHLIMGTALAPVTTKVDADDLVQLTQPVPLATAVKGSRSTSYKSTLAVSSGAKPYSGSKGWADSVVKMKDSAEISLQMAESFRIVDHFQAITTDKEYRFPVLLHWSFTTTGDTTFRYLMENLDSRLLGDVGSQHKALSGRLPLEVAGSGHVGLGHQTRDGDRVRAWYRGPLVPHPTKNTGADRLKLAHSSDQLRLVIPDGREDLSLATAFETGRLLTLSQPSIIAALMRWRQTDYQAARLRSLLEGNRILWEEILGTDFNRIDMHRIGPMVGRVFAGAIVGNPERFLGNPRPRVSPGRPLEFEGEVTAVLARGLGLEPSLFKGDLKSVLSGLREVQVPREDLVASSLGKVSLRETLEADLNRQRVDLVSNALSDKLLDDRLTGPAFPVTEEVLGGNLDVSLRDLLRRSSMDEDEL